jgi:Gpi18-like mannosyltransferase
VPALADVGSGGMLYLIARRLKGPGAGLLAAAFYLFNPASIFLTSIWGQWDSVSAFFLLAASWLLIRGSPEWSLPVLTYAVLIKPLLAAVVPLFVLGFVIRYLLPHLQAGSRVALEPMHRSVRRCCIGIAASMLVLLAVILPFSVGVPPFPTHWTLLGRLRFAASLYPFTTMNAFNLWFSPLAGDMNPDTRVFLFSLTYRLWGSILLAGMCLAVFLLYWKRRDDLAFLWAILGITFSTFVFATRMHERYLLPAVVFAALLAAVTPRLRWLFILVSATYLANLIWAYGLYPDVHSPLYLSTLQLFTYVVSLGNVALLLYALVRGYVRPALASVVSHAGRAP